MSIRYGCDQRSGRRLRRRGLVVASVGRARRPARALAYGMVALVRLLGACRSDDWGDIAVAAAGRSAGCRWPPRWARSGSCRSGLAIGLSPRLATWLAAGRAGRRVVPGADPVPDPAHRHGRRSACRSTSGAMFLMLLGTQWYILFNVVSGAMAIPADLREAARAYRLPLGQRLRHLYLPAIFPYLVTGWVTAAGGAWNPSIVAEFFTIEGQVGPRSHRSGGAHQPERRRRRTFRSWPPARWCWPPSSC